MTCGTGIGLSCNGDLSNLTFFCLAELGHVQQAGPDHEALKFYARFKDDLFMVLRSNFERRFDWLLAFRGRGTFFEMSSKESAAKMRP